MTFSCEVLPYLNCLPASCFTWIAYLHANDFPAAAIKSFTVHTKGLKAELA